MVSVRGRPAEGLACDYRYHNKDSSPCGSPLDSLFGVSCHAYLNLRIQGADMMSGSANKLVSHARYTIGRRIAKA